MSFIIKYLDHVAIRVKDMEVSAAWYTRVLGLKRKEVEAWGPFPVFMLAGKCGVALFPANEEDAPCDPLSKNVKIDHFAFHVSPEEFNRAKGHYDELEIPYTISDHQYFHSIYTKDPDGHTVELTTLVVNEADFFDE